MYKCWFSYSSLWIVGIERRKSIEKNSTMISTEFDRKININLRAHFSFPMHSIEAKHPWKIWFTLAKPFKFWFTINLILNTFLCFPMHQSNNHSYSIYVFSILCFAYDFLSYFFFFICTFFESCDSKGPKKTRMLFTLFSNFNRLIALNVKSFWNIKNPKIKYSS